MSTIRAFIAVHLPDAVKDVLSKTSRALADQIPTGAVRWVRPEQMHLTLFFLGDTAVTRLPAVQQAMDGTAGHFSPFNLYTNDVGCFPNARQPRVIWVGLAGEEARLTSLKAAIDAALGPLGWPAEHKPFRAHLTLGRVKDNRGLGEVKWTADVARLAIPVAAIHLIESQLRPSGPIYTIRHTSKLAGSSSENR